ncbi:hypothetical protein D3C75_896130 [compost metagenome]
MNRTWIWLLLLAVPLLLAGCGNDGMQQNEAGLKQAAEASQGTVNQTTTSGAADASPAASGHEPDPQFADASADYPRKIAFDIGVINDPLVNEEIKASLRNALEGIVNEDLERFNSAFISEELAKANEFGFITGGGITFTGVDYISGQSGGRVVMNVNFIRTTADGEKSYSPNYWFMQSKEGKWGLATID